ncbi:fasciclin-1 [Agrilus planipennis]|uniref:Fasciclin-1 n=1 Tax=Agrilus planipennis TaxID=224129 RepID=A0A7F5RGM7_AGRPL|nr:fasciclin-1 [Agrilus planipennis]
MVLNQSNVKGRNKGMLQVLHKIDEVLMPVMSLPSASNPLYNPTAWEFLSQFEFLDIHPYRLRSFRQRVEHEHKKAIFENDGGHTFFIPVDEGFKNSRLESIDSKVIDGHVIPGEVLFTSATPREIPYKSAAFEDNLKVVLTFSEETNGKSKTEFERQRCVARVSVPQVAVNALLNSRLESIDSKVIDGHVIPGEVLFTSATPREIPYKSAAFEDNLKVVLTFSEETNGKSKTVYIKSNTLMGDNRHPTGVVFAEIVKANIPVQNGVIHLIHKPLMIVDFTVKQFIEDG